MTDKLPEIRKKPLFLDEIEELPLVILITAFNNQKYAKNCLISALNQKYGNFEIIYVDDASTDGSDKIAMHTLKNTKNAQLILNQERVGKLSNLYREIHKLENNSIIIELDGDDYLIDDQVLNNFNHAYQKNNCLAIHANYINYPIELAKKLNIGHFSQETPFFVKKNRNFRNYPWIYSGLRSYKAELFKKIKKEDLLSRFEPYKDKFLPVFHDAAIFYPIAEMSGEKIGYIKEPMILRNIDSEINDFKVHDDKIKKFVSEQVLSSHKYEKII